MISILNATCGSVLTKNENGSKALHLLVCQFSGQ